MCLLAFRKHVALLLLLGFPCSSTFAHACFLWFQFSVFQSLLQAFACSRSFFSAGFFLLFEFFKLLLHIFFSVLEMPLQLPVLLPEF